MTTCILRLVTPTGKHAIGEPEPEVVAARPRRRRDADASRAAILEAAREVFTERGYAGATIREIAKRAGVTHGLVMRHFGSKEQLLTAALPGLRRLADALPGDLATLPERLAREFVNQIDAPGGQSTLLVMIRSGAHGEEVVGPLYAEVERHTNELYRATLGPDIDPQIDMLRALLIGVAFARSVAHSGSLASLTSEELADRLEPAIRALLGPALPPDR